MEQSRQSINLAYHFLEIGQPQRALDQLNDITGEHVNMVELAGLRGMALHQLGRNGEAIQALRGGLAFAPDSVLLLAQLSTCLAAIKDHATAEQAIQTAVRLDPNDAMLLCQYARFKLSMDDVDGAVPLIEQAAQLDGEYAPVFELRAMVFYMRGQYGHAAETSRHVLVRKPDDPRAHYLLGMSLRALGNRRQAQQHFRKAAQINPGDQDLVMDAHASDFVDHWALRPYWLLHGLGSIGLYVLVVFVLWMAMMVDSFVLGKPRFFIVAIVAYGVLLAYLRFAPRLRIWLLRLKHRT